MLKYDFWVILNDQFLYFPNRVSPYWGYPLSEWFNNHPYFDIISSGEGEITISEILVENLNINQLTT